MRQVSGGLSLHADKPQNMKPIPRIIKITAADAHSAGVELGRALGGGFELYIDRYMARRVAATANFDRALCRRKAICWIGSLPEYLRDRFTGLSLGSGIAYEKVAEWGYLELGLNRGCSSLFCRSGGKTWLAHNNDTFVPELWGYATIFNIAGRLATMNFGLAGDIWTTAGINESQLWLHVDYLAVADAPDPEKALLPTYGFVVEALETCETVADISHLLGTIDRTDGMILFAVDGKSDQAAVFECACSQWAMQSFDSKWLARTNHALIGRPVAAESHRRPFDSWSRLARLEILLQQKCRPGVEPQWEDLQNCLADNQVERRGQEFATAYSVVACPADKRIQFTFGGVPAATLGSWNTVEWPW
ncbi:MAG: hypothetical protein GKR89_19030 [Candidatus Latescibacteria bacterium]|nr:hypothetical protein [Candidatus Latescibacterota bacterium]